MSQIGAADIAVGQVWYRSVALLAERGLYRVDSISGDRVTLSRLRRGGGLTVSVASLLAYWVLARETVQEPAS